MARQLDQWQKDLAKAAEKLDFTKHLKPVEQIRLSAADAKIDKQLASVVDLALLVPREVEPEQQMVFQPHYLDKPHVHIPHVWIPEGQVGKWGLEWEARQQAFQPDPLTA